MTTPLYLDQILNGALIIDDELTIHFWNHWLEVHTGIKRHEVVGKKIDEVFPDVKTRLLQRKLRIVFSLKSPAFINAGAEKYLFKIPSKKIANKYFEYMLQDVVVTEYNPEEKQALFMIYDQTSLVETRERLEESTAELRAKNSILENIMDFQSNILFVMDNGKITSYNKNFVDIFGVETLNEFSRKDKDLISFVKKDGLPEEFDSFHSLISYSIDSGKINRLFVVDKNGFEKTFLFSTKQVPGDDGMVIVSMTDITEIQDKEKVLNDINTELSRKFDLKNIELKKLNMDLYRNRNQLALAQKVAKLGSIDYNSSTGAVFVSDGLRDILEDDSFMPKNLNDVYSIFNKDDFKVLKKLTEESFKHESEFSVSSSLKTGKGEVKILRIHGKCVDKYKSGDVRFIMTIHDVTNEKELEKKVNEREQMVRSIFHVADIGFAILDSSDKVIRINKRFSDITGYGEEELVGKDLSLLKVETYHSEFGKYFNVSEDVDEIVLMCKCGEKRYAYMNISEYYTEDDSRYKFIAFTDITESIYAQQQQKEQEQLLIQQSKLAAMGEMIGVIGHQWKQPLNSLGLILENMKMDVSDDEMDAESMLRMIELSFHQVHFMSETIDDFREFFNNDNRIVNFDCVRTIENTSRLLESLLKNKGIALKIENKAGEECFVKGVKNEFRHTILNILTNAKDSILEKLKSSKFNKGIIKINIKSDDNFITISIIDNGIGFNEDSLEKAFEPYFTTKGSKGSGIGMYMARLIINKRMGGEISISNIDSGAKVVIKLPKI
jgi:PAS domain S-box-containing protein